MKLVHPFDLHGKRFLVTGASSGIGHACAVLAAQPGATVVITGVNLPDDGGYLAQ